MVKMVFTMLGNKVTLLLWKISIKIVIVQYYCKEGRMQEEEYIHQ